MTIANSRGAKESGTLFAIPAYGLVTSIYIMLATGFIECLGGCPRTESVNTHLEPESTLTLFLVLEKSERTVVAQIADAVFGGGYMFYVVQAMTAVILILAPIPPIRISQGCRRSWLRITSCRPSCVLQRNRHPRPARLV